MAKKGKSRLAAVLQSRMGTVNQSQTAEVGKMQKNGIILEDFPDDVIGPDEYGLCCLGKEQEPREGDEVLIVWADDLPVIVGVLKKES